MEKHEREYMISIISDFDSVYQIRRRLGQSSNGHPIPFSGRKAEFKIMVDPNTGDLMSGNAESVPDDIRHSAVVNSSVVECVVRLRVLPCAGRDEDRHYGQQQIGCSEMP
jgi:hypothetical protein